MGLKGSEDLNLVNGGTVSTPLKFNMEPENQPLEKEIPFGNHHFPPFFFEFSI